MSNNDSTLSKTITFLRFPLIVAVVFVHTNLASVEIDGNLLVNEEDIPIYSLINHIVSNELARIPTRLFFLISGFLFFYHLKSFSLQTYGRKLKKRVHSLLIPYLFWNLALFLKAAFDQLVRLKIPLKSKPIADYDWSDFLNVFWVYEMQDNTMPFDYPLWFMRDLMVISLFTPIIYWLIKHCKVYSILVLGGFWLFDFWFTTPGFNIRAFFFFSLGAWFSINQRDFTATFLPMRWASTALYVVLVIVNTWLWHSNITDYTFIFNLGIITGLVAVVSWTAYAIEKGRLHANPLLTESSFMIYAFHILPLGILQYRWMKYLPINEFTMITGYLLIPTIVVGVIIGIYALMRKYLPKFTAIITGGR